jgi:hypothetical protein
MQDVREMLARLGLKLSVLVRPTAKTRSKNAA